MIDPDLTGTDVGKLAFMHQALAHRQQQQLGRQMRSWTAVDAVTLEGEGGPWINFSANDYMGLLKHPQVMAGACQAVARYGAGSGASRLVTGTTPLHQEVEERLALACGREAALLLSTGFQANSTILGTLIDRSGLALWDRYNHNSLIQGVLASQAPFQRFRHQDLNHLEHLLKQARHTSPPDRRVVIATETVFSMEGDRADVGTLVALAQRYGAMLYVDDAHGVGVLGPGGMGLAAHQPEIEVTVGTFGKAFGSFGAFVAGSRLLRDYLVNCCPGVIYTTALPPAVVGAIAAVLDLLPTLEPQRQALQAQAQTLRQQIQALGYTTDPSSTHIIPIRVGEADRALALAQHLYHRGVLALAIRPPTVPPGTARLRLALSSAHRPEHYDLLLQALASWPKESRVV